MGKRDEFQFYNRVYFSVCERRTEGSNMAGRERWSPAEDGSSRRLDGPGPPGLPGPAGCSIYTVLLHGTERRLLC